MSPSVLSLGYYVVMVVGVLVAVSFYTLYERKILGAAHLRKGPNVIGWFGVLQPFTDAIKLFSKEALGPSTSNYLIYTVSPVSLLGLAVLSWVVIPFSLLVWSFKYLIILFFIITTAGVYSHLGCGWSSNSNYAMVGGLRCVAQSLSYEISLVFLFMSPMFMYYSIDLMDYYQLQETVWLVFVVPLLATLWWLSSIAETNRSPFDFAESESELVSGFNVEYGSGLFAFMFIAEYASMLFMSFMLVVLFLGGGLVTPSVYAMVALLSYTFVWVRVSYPRTRYDKLMGLSWLVVLPFSLTAIVWMISVV